MATFPATAAKPYRVYIASLYDTDERDVIRLLAYGEQDIRAQVREYHPGYYVRKAEAQCRGCDPHEEHQGPCGHQWSGERFVQQCQCGRTE